MQASLAKTQTLDTLVIGQTATMAQRRLFVCTTAITKESEIKTEPLRPIRRIVSK